MLFRREFPVLWTCSLPVSFRKSWPHWPLPEIGSPDVKIKNKGRGAVAGANSWVLLVSQLALPERLAQHYPALTPILSPIMGRHRGVVRRKAGWDAKRQLCMTLGGTSPIQSLERHHQQKGAGGKVSRKQLTECMLTSRSKNASSEHTSARKSLKGPVLYLSQLSHTCPFLANLWPMPPQ